MDDGVGPPRNGSLSWIPASDDGEEEDVPLPGWPKTYAPSPTYIPVTPVTLGPTDSPTHNVTPDISIDTFDSTCK